MSLDSKSTKKIVLSVVFVAILVVLGHEFYKQQSISKNEATIEGKIVDFFHVNKARYAIKYEYFVDGEKYIGQVGITPFKCENGKEGCIGKTFKVYYSSKNPSLSRINLGKYEKYKTTVEFFE